MAPVLGSALSVALLVAATSVAATAGVSLVVLATAVEAGRLRHVMVCSEAARIPYLFKHHSTPDLRDGFGFDEPIV